MVFPSTFKTVGMLLLLLLGTLAAMTAHAGTFLASTSTVVPITSFDTLTSACAAVQAGSTVQAMYGQGTAIADEVTALMQNASITQAYVAAWYTSIGWAWQVTQMGEVAYSGIDGSAFVSGVLPDHTVSGSFTVYDTTGKGLVATTGTSPYQVVCYNERLVPLPKKKGFPWWGILIIVLGSVAIIAVVVVVVVCCCCCKNKKRSFDDADDDDASMSSRSRSQSFSSTSRSSRSGTSTSSGSFSSRGSSYTGSSKSSAVSGTTGSGSYSDASSSGTDTSSSRVSSSRGSSSRASSSRGSFSRGSSSRGSSSAASSSASSGSYATSQSDTSSVTSHSTSGSELTR